MNVFVKIWTVLNPTQRATAVGLFGLMLIGMLLEMLGLGIILPALAIVASDSATASFPSWSAWMEWLGNPSRGMLLVYGLAVLLTFHAFKAGFILFATWQQSRFIRDLQCDIAERLFTTYLFQPWAFHLGRNSAELIRNVGDVWQFAAAVAVMLAIIAEVLVLGGVVALLMWIEPMGAIAVAAILLTATLILARATKARLLRWGKEIQQHSGLAGRHIMQGMHAAKDIKVLGREQSFVAPYIYHSRRRGIVSARLGLLSQVPRLWFELLAVAALCLLTTVMVWQGKGPNELIPTLGLFAAAAFRLLPSVNRLSGAIQTLRSSEAVVNTVSAELALPKPARLGNTAGRFTFRQTVELKNVTFRYTAAHEPALREVDIAIPHGAAVGLIGGSGAGKSTLVDVVLGLLDPTAGRVLVDGVDIATNLRGWQRLVGYVPQSIYLCDDTIRRNIAFGVPDDQIDEAAIRRSLGSAQLSEFVATLPAGADTVIGDRGVRLSGGQRQRIGIARALYHDPELLVLDEATSALDNDTERGVMEAIEALHGAKTLLIVAHRLTTVQRCDLIYQFSHGRVVRSGSYQEVVLG